MSEEEKLEKQLKVVVFWKQSGSALTGLEIHPRAGVTVFLTQNNTRGETAHSLCQGEKNRGGVKQEKWNRLEGLIFSKYAKRRKSEEEEEEVIKNLKE